MSTNLAEPIDFQGWVDEPAATRSADYQQKSKTHYGCSPAFDISLAGRNVGTHFNGMIRKCALAAFRNTEERVNLAKGDEAPPAALSVGSDPGGRYYMTEKTAYDCATEIRFAYNNTNSWGFVIFDDLTGLSFEAARRIFQTVLPRPMNLPQMADHLSTQAVFDVQEIGDTRAEGIAESVRATLLRGVGEAMAFCRETLDASAQEVSERRSGGHGKAKFDRRDELLAAALGETLPNITAMPQQQPAPTPIIVQADTSSKDDIIERQSQQIDRLMTSVEQLFAAKTPKQKKSKTAEV